MDAADLHDLELIWPSLHPKDVIVTGTFDQWSSTIRLVKGGNGFSSIVKVPWGQKIAYKFIVDGRWQCRDDRPQEEDRHGNINNVLHTPEKPQVVLPAVHDLPTRLSIPLEGVQDVETMVTAVEFLPLAESAMVKGPLPLPIPQISVEGLGLAPSIGTPASASRLDTATATEGTVPPASKVPAEPVPFEQENTLSVVPILSITADGTASHLPVNGNGEPHDSHSFATHAPIQFTKGELSTSPSVPETAKEAVSTTSETQSDRYPQEAQGVATHPDPIDATSVPIASAVLESTAKQPEVDLDNVAQGQRRQAAVPSSISQVSSPSTPASSTLTHKKRRSFFARIKHIFERDNDKREKKEENKR